MSAEVTVLACDLFGTIFDWRGTIVAEGQRLAPGLLRTVSWISLAESWARAYARRVRGQEEWTPLDVLLVDAFRELAHHYGLERLRPETWSELSTVWARLRPWPDAARGLERLGGRFRLATFSNANLAMQESLLTSSGLAFDKLVSAEMVKVYKPHPDVYREALKVLSEPAERVLLVAAHAFDLNASSALGFPTALIQRSSEPGSSSEELDHQPAWIVPDFDALADALLRAANG